MSFASISRRSRAELEMAQHCALNLRLKRVKAL
jgi:hypothetical protein